MQYYLTDVTLSVMCERYTRAYCKSLYFRVFFILWLKTFLQKFKFAMHDIFLCALYIPYILRECWIRERSNLRLLAKIKFSQIIVILQYNI